MKDVDYRLWTVTEEAHAWPQLRKLFHQLSRTFSPGAPNTQRLALTTLGNFVLFYCGDLTSVTVHCSSAGKKDCYLSQLKTMTSEEPGLKDLYSLCTVVSLVYKAAGANMLGKYLKRLQKNKLKCFIKAHLFTCYRGTTLVKHPTNTIPLSPFPHFTASVLSSNMS